MEFDFASYFLYHDFGLTHIRLEDQTKKGKSIIALDSNYLRGRIQDDENKLIKVKESVFQALREVYQTRIIPLFGEYSQEGFLKTRGLINFIDSKNNPTGMYKELLAYAETGGTFIKQSFGKGERLMGYKPNNPDKYVLIVTDHLRKFILERGWDLKKTVDKAVEYHTEIRNLCNYSFIDIIHTNRNIVNSERLKFSGDMLYPTSEDIKSTGNLSEDCDYLITMFNPNDDRYKLKSHFGMDIRDGADNILYPNMRTLHLVESRHCEYPQHFKTNMLGGYKSFETLNIN